VVFCEDFDQAKRRYKELLVHGGDSENKGQMYYLFDPEEEDPAEKGKNTRLFKALDGKAEPSCIVTWQVGIRGINYWKQCYPVAWFAIKAKSDYEQFLGRSNREFPAQIEQRGAVVVPSADARNLSREEFESKLLNE